MLVISVMGCGGAANDTSAADDVLFTVGDSTVRESEITALIPRGISSADSAALFESIALNRLKNLILTEVALKNIPDPERIERLVTEYRNDLIVSEYMRTLANEKLAPVSEKQIADYYKSHAAELTLKEPLVKGVYIRVPETSNRIAEIRNLISRYDVQSLDRLEKSGLRESMDCYFFDNQWTAWSSVADEIPYRFGNADDFVENHTDFETSRSGYVYLLHLSEYLPTGAAMPYEAAKQHIAELLSVENRARYEAELINNLYKEAKKNKQLTIGTYRPAAHRAKTTIQQ